MNDNPLENFKINRQKLKDNHVYNEKYEHDNCGVGLVASINGDSRRDIVEKGVEALKACLLYTSPSPRDRVLSRMPSSA